MPSPDATKDAPKDIVLAQKGVWLPADVQTPISLFLKLVGPKHGILLESAEVDGRLGRFSLICWDFKLRLSCAKGKLEVVSSDKRFEPLLALNGMDFLPGLRAAMGRLLVKPEPGFENLPPITRGLYGCFNYNIAGHFEPKLAAVLPPDKAETTLVLPGNVVLYDHLHHRCCYLTINEGDFKRPVLDEPAALLPHEQPEAGIVRNDPDEAEFKTLVAKARDLIHQGEAIQVVVSSRFSAPFQGEPFALYRRLRQVNPSPYMFFMRLPRVTLIGSSPELMVRCQDSHLEVRPIAGTRKRGGTDEEDMRLAEDLLQDPKERAEHVMLVDLGRNDLGRIATPGSVAVDKFMNVERFSHVMHLTSYIHAKLKPGLDAIDVLASTFPAGTVSGAPKVRAMEIIADLERQDRGPYAGAVGWLGLDAGRVDLDTGITIRSMWVKDGMVNFQAGAGVVFDSDPDFEWHECQNKARVIREVLAGKEAGDVFAY